MYACMYVCVCVYVFVIVCAYTYIYIYIYWTPFTFMPMSASCFSVTKNEKHTKRRSEPCKSYQLKALWPSDKLTCRARESYELTVHSQDNA